ncbi:hypothetical protein WICPIJ_009139 [Wickerhamomyces pijperi]|uniref:Uncharacterized protein n=1 Tax=Wickerhamomyces pijperi TaxID=599730 RepID=A0A9P8PRU7_WICPI|nr:hypothetical protein WICPIJ_009139 [Wickerhamomyces pijperi]
MSTPPCIEDSYPRLTEQSLQKLQEYLTSQEKQRLQMQNETTIEGNSVSELDIRCFPTLSGFRVEELFLHGDDKYTGSEDQSYCDDREHEELQATRIHGTSHIGEQQRVLEDPITSKIHSEDNNDTGFTLPIKDTFTTAAATRSYNNTMNTTFSLRANINDRSVSQLQIDKSLLSKASVHIHNGSGNSGTVSRIFDPNDTALLFNDRDKFSSLKVDVNSNLEKSSVVQKEVGNENGNEENSPTPDHTKLRGSSSNLPKKSNISALNKRLQLRDRDCKLKNSKSINKGKGKPTISKNKKISFNLKFPNLNI